MTKALGKEGSFVESSSNSPRQRFFGKNPANFFAEGQGVGPRQRVKKIQKNHFFAEDRPSAKNFLKILKISLPRVREEALGKSFLKKIKKFICRGSALGKQIQKNHFFAEGRPSAKKPPTAPALTASFLCRVPDKGPSAKTPSPSKNSPRGLCRGQPSAKPLPRVSSPLPRARGPRQSMRLQ